MSSVESEPATVVDRTVAVSDGDGITRQASAGRRLWRRGRRAMERGGVRNTPIGRARTTSFRIVSLCIFLFGWGLRLCGLYGLGMRNALVIRRRDMVLSFPDLPEEFDGYRLLHLTDLHLDTAIDVEEPLMNVIAGSRVDACVMTGDYRERQDEHFADILAPMARIVRTVSADDGHFATLGNHDHHGMAAAFEDMGITVLVNESVTLRRGMAHLNFTGLDDVRFFYTPMADLALDSAPEGFSVALVHSPEMAAAAAENGFALYLCGHTHGGQVCLPGGRPIVTRLVRNRNLAAGLWRMGRMIGYTSSGIGVSGPPVRFFSAGEATFITLRRGGGDSLE